MCPAAERTGAPQRTALVVDRDPASARWICEVLDSAGFAVRTAEHAADALAVAEEEWPDLVVVAAELDPGGDGVELARRLRALSSTFIVLHSESDEEIDVVRGLNAGADSYLLRPLSGRELKVRIAAVMRRPPVPGRTRPAAAPVVPQAGAEPGAGPGAPPPATRVEDGWIVNGSLRVQPDDAVAYVGGRALVLNPRAFDLLEVLLYAEGEPRSTGDLAIAVHDDPAADADLERVDLLVAGLTQSLRNADPSRAWIAREAEGYRLV